MRVMMLLLISCVALECHSQRKIPNITFLENSLEFADANKAFDDYGQLTDTLRDENIIRSLAKILVDNPQLQIELSGHCATNEDSSFAIQRANRVMQLLIENDVDSSRITIVGHGSQFPIIKNEVLLSLSSKIEREAANQKNRRVEIRVVGIKEEQ